MQLLENNGTKRSMALSILEAYERVNGTLEQPTFDGLVKQLSRHTKERLQRYLEYIEIGDDSVHDAAYCILLATNRKLPTIK